MLPRPPNAPIPPQNVGDAVLYGGFPELWTADQLVWLAAKHTDLGTRKKARDDRDEAHLRWAYQISDVLKSCQKPSRR